MAEPAAPLRILVVCTANVCRSPLAADVLRRGTTGTRITSAGIDAVPGEPMCAQSAACAHDHDPQPDEAAATATETAAGHRATPLTADLLADADLVLVLDRTHRAAAARLAPACRPRMLTLRQAAAIAGQIASTVSQGDLPDGAPALPASPQDRLAWLVAELDAGRGTLAGWPEGREDIPDDHGTQDHRATLDDVARTAEALAVALTAVAGGPPPDRG